MEMTGKAREAVLAGERRDDADAVCAMAALERAAGAASAPNAVLIAKRGRTPGHALHALAERTRREHRDPRVWGSPNHGLLHACIEQLAREAGTPGTQEEKRASARAVRAALAGARRAGCDAAWLAGSARAAGGHGARVIASTRPGGRNTQAKARTIDACVRVAITAIRACAESGADTGGKSAGGLAALAASALARVGKPRLTRRGERRLARWARRYREDEEEAAHERCLRAGAQALLDGADEAPQGWARDMLLARWVRTCASGGEDIGEMRERAGAAIRNPALRAETLGEIGAQRLSEGGPAQTQAWEAARATLTRLGQCEAAPRACAAATSRVLATATGCVARARGEDRRRALVEQIRALALAATPRPRRGWSRANRTRAWILAAFEGDEGEAAQSAAAGLAALAEEQGGEWTKAHDARAMLEEMLESASGGETEGEAAWLGVLSGANDRRRACAQALGEACKAQVAGAPWVDIARLAAHAGVEEATIRSWGRRLASGDTSVMIGFGIGQAEIERTSHEDAEDE